MWPEIKCPECQEEWSTQKPCLFDLYKCSVILSVTSFLQLVEVSTVLIYTWMWVEIMFPEFQEDSAHVKNITYTVLTVFCTVLQACFQLVHR